MKIIFFGTSSVAVPILQKLYTAHQIVAVVTSPDAPVGRRQVLTPSPVARLATELNAQTFKPEKVKGNSELLEQLKSLEADIFIVASYGKILPLEIINLPHLKTLNVHFSLLPKYRGAAPIQHAILNGETESGTTIFILDELLDHGPVLAQEKISIYPDDTAEILMGKMAQMSADLLLQVLPKYQNGEITPEEQDHTKATKAPILKKDDGFLDFTESAQMCYNKYRGLKSWPGVYTKWNGKVLKIIGCVPALPPLGGDGSEAESGKNSLTPHTSHLTYASGTILPGGIIVCGENTYLQIQKLQLEGGKIMDIKNFLNGYKNFVGTSLQTNNK